MTYRPHDMKALLRFAGIDSDRVSIFPVMAEQFHIKCQDEGHARDVRERLRDVKVDGGSAIFARAEGESVFAGCSIHTLQEQDKIATSRKSCRREVRRSFLHDSHHAKDSMSDPECCGSAHVATRWRAKKYRSGRSRRRFCPPWA